MKNKLLVRINKIEEIELYKKEGIENFLFPLCSFSIGYNTFNLEELSKLDCHVYLLINRVFDNKAVEEFKLIKEKLNFVSGIIYEDIAVYQILKNSDINLIWNQAHFAVNYHSINFWLDRVSSCVISNELEQSEVNNILNNVSKKVILPVLGLNMAMYSRRYLISYYSQTFGKDVKEKAIIKNNNVEFLAKENEFGTVLFFNKYFNLLKELKNMRDEKILYYYINPNELEASDIIDILNGKEIDYDNTFYHEKTVFKVGDLK